MIESASGPHERGRENTPSPHASQGSTQEWTPGENRLSLTSEINRASYPGKNYTAAGTRESITLG